MQVAGSCRRVLPTESGGASLWLFVRSVSCNGGCPAPQGNHATVTEHTRKDHVILSLPILISARRSNSCSCQWPSTPSILQQDWREGCVRVRVQPLSARQLQQELHRGQSKVQRAMTSLFGEKPFLRYREKCRNRDICGFFLCPDGTRPRPSP